MSTVVQMPRKSSNKLSCAEIQKNYRQRKRNDEFLAKERARWHRRRENKSVKVIADCTSREQRVIRKDWRERQARCRSRKKQNTSPEPEGDDVVSSTTDSRQRTQGTKHIRRENSKCNRRIVKLESLLNLEMRSKDRYRKRLERLQARTGHVKGKTPPASSSSMQYTDSIRTTTQSLRLSSPATPRTKTNTMLEGAVVPKTVRKALMFHHALVDEIKLTKSKAKKEEDKRIMSNLVRGNILKRYRLVRHAKGSGVPLSKKKAAEGFGHCKRVRAAIVDADTRSMVEQFFERDDNSRVTTGKKETVTKNKVRKQKRLLSDTLMNLHDKYCAENIKNAVSYSTFSKLRPFWICTPTAKDRQTCLCKKHENVTLKVEKLHQLKLINTKNPEDLLADVCCDVKNKQCMYRECDACKNKDVLFSSSAGDDNTANNAVFWWEWKTEEDQYQKGDETRKTKRTVKKLERGTVSQLKLLFSMELRNDLCCHVFNVRHQFREYKKLKENLSDREAVIHIDFSENYNLKYASEIQSCHFGASQQQATLHTGVVYKAETNYWSFASISSSLQHGPAGIWAHMDPVLETIREESPGIDVVHFFSDGPTNQYRNKTNFYLFSTKLFEYGFHSGTWNFFESAHGKGAPDAVGGALKRKADRLVNNGQDLSTAEQLYTALNTGSVVRLYLIDAQSITKIEQQMMGKKLIAIPRTMKVHQLWTSSAATGSVSCRVLSCFCNQPEQCDCYELTVKNFIAGAGSASNDVNPNDSAASLTTADVQSSVQVECPVPSHETVVAELSTPCETVVEMALSTTNVEGIGTEPLATECSGSESAEPSSMVPELANQDQSSNIKEPTTLMTGLGTLSFYSRSSKKVCGKSASALSLQKESQPVMTASSRPRRTVKKPKYLE